MVFGEEPERTREEHQHGFVTFPSRDDLKDIVVHEMEQANMKKVYWTGHLESEDDFGDPIVDEFIDGKTVFGPWAIMTPHTFKIKGVGQLGTGLGQRYVKQRDGKWLKVEG
jgi:hypothetical protein